MGKKILSLCALATLCAVLLSRNSPTGAQTGGFALQVTPSPIVETIDPGTTKTIDLKIRNQNTQKETLKMAIRAFEINGESGEVTLKNDEPVDVKDWVAFSDPSFDVQAGEWFTQKITFTVPESAGFSYSFAITIIRAEPRVEPGGGKTSIEGSVAVFVLLNTNRSDATRKLDIVSFSSEKKVYEYLPSSFNLKIKNSGNTNVPPAGNIYIQKSVNSTSPIAVLPVNNTSAYILPNVTRTLKTDWKEGFPVFTPNPDKEGLKRLTWNWSKLQNFRIGKYTAKAVVIYNDGSRDVPVEAVVSFWVIPWKLLLVLGVMAILLIVGVVTILRKGIRLTQKKQKKDVPDKE